MMCTNNCSRAFTLIELMIVMGIISLLIGILLPAMSLVRGRARSTLCMSNLRQVNTVLQSFAADYQGQYPRNRSVSTGDSAANQTAHKTWRAFLVQGGYLPGDASEEGEPVGDPARAGGQGATGRPDVGPVWVCPTVSDAPLRELLDGSSRCVGDVASHYAYNGEIAWREYPLPAGQAEPPGSLVKITSPSQTIVLLETRSWWPDLRLRSIQGRGRYPGADKDGSGYFSFWHGNGAGNWAMYDGSVATRRLVDTLDPQCMWFAELAEAGAYAHTVYWVAENYR